MAPWLQEATENNKIALSMLRVLDLEPDFFQLMDLGSKRRFFRMRTNLEYLRSEHQITGTDVNGEGGMSRISKR